MENIPPETTEKKVPSKSFAITSLVCGIISLAGGGLIIVLPILAVIFGAIPLNQGKGTQWDGKGMAVAGLVTGIIGLAWVICCVSFYGTWLAWLGMAGATAPFGIPG